MRTCNLQHTRIKEVTGFNLLAANTTNNKAAPEADVYAVSGAVRVSAG